ncbi:hypothetical protein FRB99_005739 [Tulasnella sp. 403]|nr:hypothetical protein FRB99_005739 [Tulasnella sp. 403]
MRILSSIVIFFSVCLAFALAAPLGLLNENGLVEPSSSHGADVSVSYNGYVADAKHPSHLSDFTSRPASGTLSRRGAKAEAFFAFWREFGGKIKAAGTAVKEFFETLLGGLNGSKYKTDIIG